MKMTLIWTLVALLCTGVASAEMIIAGDGGTTAFGDTQGFAIDFDSTPAANADWTPDLVAGTTYKLNSISITYGGPGIDGDNGVAKYLGVYTGLSSGVLSGFLGASTNTFPIATAVAGDLATWNFSGIQVTADSTVGGGAGLLYFAYQDVNTATSLGGNDVDFPTRRFENSVTDPTSAMSNTLSSIIAFGGLQAGRAPEYQANLSRIPEPTTFVLLGLCGAALLGARRVR